MGVQTKFLVDGKSKSIGFLLIVFTALSLFKKERTGQYHKQHTRKKVRGRRGQAAAFFFASSPDSSSPKLLFASPSLGKETTATQARFPTKRANHPVKRCPPRKLQFCFLRDAKNVAKVTL